MKKYYLLLSILWLIFTLLGTLLPAFILPHPPGPLQFTGWDKVVHFFLFFFLNYLLVKTLFMQFHKTFYISVICATCFSLFVGGGTEYLQTLMHQGRSGDWMDFAANCTGIVVSIIFVFLGHSKSVRNKKGNK